MSFCIHGKELYDNCFLCFPPQEFSEPEKLEEKIAALQAERIAALEAELTTLRERAEAAEKSARLFGGILAVIHRDGGHYLDADGSDKPFQDAHQIWGEMQSELSTLREAGRWIPVRERLPPIDTPVLVQCKHYPEHITCAMRYDEGDGWIWGQLTGYNATINRPDSYEFDDEYEYLAWMPIPKPPQEQD